MAQKNYFNERLMAFKAQLQKSKLDGFAVTNNLDQFYLSGFYFYPDEAVFLIHKKGITCFTRGLYVEPFSKFAPYMEVIGDDGQRIVAAIEKAHKLGLKRPGFDAAKETFISGGLLRDGGFIPSASFITSWSIPSMTALQSAGTTFEAVPPFRLTSGPFPAWPVTFISILPFSAVATGKPASGENTMGGSL